MCRKCHVIPKFRVIAGSRTSISALVRCHKLIIVRFNFMQQSNHHSHRHQHYHRRTLFIIALDVFFRARCGFDLFALISVRFDRIKSQWIRSHYVDHTALNHWPDFHIGSSPNAISFGQILLFWKLTRKWRQIQIDRLGSIIAGGGFTPQSVNSNALWTFLD